jgi:hypothetical protein
VEPRAGREHQSSAGGYAVKVVNTSSWSFEQISPYTARITALFRKLEAQFPDDVTAKMLARECITGGRTLWLVLDGEDLKAICMTQIRVTETGKKIAALMDLAGEDPDTWADAVCGALEGWADEAGAELRSVEGRAGWDRILRKRGYREYARLWRKAA